jgi:hypothetical protein
MPFSAGTRLAEQVVVRNVSRASTPVTVSMSGLAGRLIFPREERQDEQAHDLEVPPKGSWRTRQA